MSQAFLELLDRHETFLLAGHEHPDGDCLGAETALWHLLDALGKRACVLNPDPIPRSLDFLARHTPIESFQEGRALPPHEVVVLLDCAHLARLGRLGEAVAAARDGRVVAVVDHHVGSERGDGDVAFVDPTAPATGALVARCWTELGRPLSTPAAEGVFVSLVSDTGWFRHSNTDAAVLRLAADLVEGGVDPCGLYDAMYRRNAPDSVGLLSEALARHAFSLDGRYAWTWFDADAMKRAAKVDFDTDVVLDVLRSVEGVEVVAVLKVIPGGKTKVSLRAKGEVDVQAIAARLGGGGHRKAAGATVDMELAECARAVEDLVGRALEVEARPPTEEEPRT